MPLLEQLLRRIVEFLNGQMDPAEVLAVEIKQFVGQGLKTLVPRLIGQTVEAERKKSSSRPAPKQWDEAGFFQALQHRKSEEEAAAARAILAWAQKKLLRIYWGSGSKDGSFTPTLDYKGVWHTIVSIYT